MLKNGNSSNHLIVFCKHMVRSGNETFEEKRILFDHILKIME